MFSCSFGFVEYATVEEAKKVLERSENVELDGRTLTINFGKSRGGEGVLMFCFMQLSLFL